LIQSEGFGGQACENLSKSARVGRRPNFSKQYRRVKAVALVLVRSDCDPSTSSLLASNWLLYRKDRSGRKKYSVEQVAGARAATVPLDDDSSGGQRRQVIHQNKKQMNGKAFHLRLRPSSPLCTDGK
jgi:hypothetical protein